MARTEQDREDILREATALVERVQISIPAYPELIVAGFRRDGSASFYFGSDPVLQFNTARQIRRGFERGQLLKASGGQLVRLERVRTQQEVTLSSAPLPPDQSADYQRRMLALLALLRAGLQSGTARIDGQVPPNGDVAGRVLRWLAELPDQLEVADRPHAGS